MICRKCGGTEAFAIPAPTDDVLAQMAGFMTRHENCPASLPIDAQQPDKPGRDPREENPR